MNLPKSKERNNWGFTLIEILVVIAIIAILISIGMASYTTAQRQGRDAKRRGDLKSIQNALEQYYANNNSNYPLTSYSALGSEYFPGALPQDPRKKCDYPQTDNTAASYRICADLESAGSGFSCTGACASCEEDYCLTQLQ